MKSCTTTRGACTPACNVESPEMVGQALSPANRGQGQALAGESACPTIFAWFLLCFLACAPVFAAVTGTVTNQTTGKPQTGATVALYRLATATGLELIDQAKSDAQGNFTINQTPQGPHLIRTAFDGVTYNHMLPPGQPTTGLAIEVFNASKQPGAAKVGKHMILFEPSAGQVAVTETYLFQNDGKTAWNDPDGGTLKFYLPAGASKPKVDATAPGGMAIGAPVNKTARADVMAVDFAIKPGETRIDVTYAVPYSEGADLAGKIVTKDENTYLIVPNGVALKGDGLNDLGAEPRTQAHIFGLTGTAYKVQLTGAVAAAPAEAAAGEGAAEDSGPRIEQIMPRVNSQKVPILIVALGILALGFALLYRAGAPSELRSDRQAKAPAPPR
ncbi:MAG: carboxypeptidase-like regulatory domain-containing protein [Candidatus Solibacter sp.]